MGGAIDLGTSVNGDSKLTAELTGPKERLDKPDAQTGCLDSEQRDRCSPGVITKLAPRYAAASGYFYHRLLLFFDLNAQ